MECLPTCISAGRAAKYPRFTYAEYMRAYHDASHARDSADGVRIQAYCPFRARPMQSGPVLTTQLQGSDGVSAIAARNQAGAPDG